MQNSNFSASEILSGLKEKGIYIIPNFVSREDIEVLNSEFEKALDTADQLPGVKGMDYSVGRGCKLLINKIDSTDFQGALKIFNSDVMKEVANGYYPTNTQFILNEEIYVVNDVVGSSHHANDLHFDVVPTLKFFIYLTDTTERNGAFFCVPGSHINTATIREQYGKGISYKNRHLSRELPFTADDALPIEGSAGTLIVFTTEVMHMAGTVHEGDRRVMRGHTRPVKKSSFVSKLKAALQI